MESLSISVLFVYIAVSAINVATSYPANDYEYSLQRDNLLHDESSWAPAKFTLTEVGIFRAGQIACVVYCFSINYI